MQMFSKGGFPIPNKDAIVVVVDRAREILASPEVVMFSVERSWIPIPQQVKYSKIKDKHNIYIHVYIYIFNTYIKHTLISSIPQC